MAKFKIGDTVRITDGVLSSPFGHCGEMDGLIGSLTTITSVREHTDLHKLSACLNMDRYRIVADNGEFVWDEFSLEPA